MNLTECITMVMNSICEAGIEQCSDDVVLDCAVRIYNSQIIESRGYKPSGGIMPLVAKGETQQTPAEPATDKQVGLLKKFNRYKPGLSKKEASQIIDEAMKENKR